jgi:hypothetical protein
MEHKVTWAQAVSEILTSSNIVPLLIGIGVVLLVLTILVKKGYISLDLKGVKIGIAENERKIMRQQMEYCSHICTTFIDQQQLPPDCDTYRIMWVNELLFDEMCKWICYNHISDDRFYIENKQEIIWSIIVANTEKDFFHSDGLKKVVTDEVERIIKHLVEIRKFYGKQ